MRTLTTETAPIHVIATPADATQLWDWLTPYRLRGDLLAWDGETSGGYSPWDPRFRLRTAQISDGCTGWVIQAEKPGMLDVVRTITRAHPRWLAHFADNDIRFAERGAPGSVRLDSYEPHFMDSQVALAWYDPRTVTSVNKYPGIGLLRALKPSVLRILRTSILSDAEKALHARFRELAPVGQRTPEKYKTWGFQNIDVNDDVYLTYGGLDAIMEYRLFQFCYSEVVRRGQREGLDLDLFLQWHIDLMTFRGLPVDPAYVRWLDGALEKVTLDNASLMDTHQVRISGQGKSVGEAFGRLGTRSPMNTDGTERQYPADESNPKKKPSWDATVLGTIIDSKALAWEPEHCEAVTLAQAIIVVRKSGKFRSTYIQPMLDSAGLDGRLHCSMRVVGAPTSRMSAERPALQQLPKRHDKRIRAAAEAPDGWVFVGGDYSKGEPRTMAAKSGDLALLRDLKKGDFYSNVAARAYGKLYKPDQKEDPAQPGHQYYQNCKNGYMAHAYGCGIGKLAKLLSLNMAGAKDVKDRWDQAYTVLKARSRELGRRESVTLDSGWIAPLWDRYRLDKTGTPRCTNDDSRLGLCYETQGNLAVILKWGMKKLIDRGWSWALALIVHDEILLCVPEVLADAAMTALKECMEMEFHGVIMHVDPKIHGSTWVSRDGLGYQEDLTQLILATDG